MSTAWTLVNHSPGWLAAVGGLVALAAASGWISSRGRTSATRALLVGVRVAALVLVAAAILRPAVESDLTRAKRPPLAVVADRSTSMALGVPAPARGVADWLEENLSSLDALDGYYRLRHWEVAAPPRPLDEGLSPLGRPFADEETPLGESLQTLVERERDLAGIVLLSDGQDTFVPGDPPTLGVPVYPVIVEAGIGEDLRIDEVKAPPVGFIRTPLEIKVAVYLAGAPGPAELTLFEQGSVLLSQSFDLQAGRNELSVVFTPRRTGRKAYEVALSPRPGETMMENNRQHFSVNIIRDKTRVLLVAGTPTWDVKFLRRRLRQDPGIDLITFLILRTPADVNTVGRDEMSLIPFPTEELFNTELSSFDAVILANFDYASYVPARYLDNMVRFVREAGGGLVMTGGDRSFGLGGYWGTSLAQILPVDLSGAVPGKEYRPGPFRPRLTPAGRAHPIFSWSEDPLRNEQIWQSLPPLEGLNWALRPAPASVVLAEAPMAANEYGPAPVVALGEFGSGRTMAILTDSVWRWKMPYSAEGGDESVYRDFWTRALRWLVHDPDMETVRLAAVSDTLRARAPHRFTARVLDRSYAPATGALLRSTLRTDGGDEVVALDWREIAPGEYATAPATLAAEGLYHLKVEALAGAEFLGTDQASFYVNPASPEPLRVGVDREYLTALAERSGGRVFDAGDSALFDHLGQRGEEQVEVIGRAVEEPWATPWLLALSLCLLGLDWALRRVLE